MGYISSCTMGIDRVNYENIWKKSLALSNLYLEQKVSEEEVDGVQNKSKGNGQDFLEAYKVMSGNKSSLVSKSIELDMVSLASQDLKTDGKEMIESATYTIISTETSTGDCWSIINKKTGQTSHFYPESSSLQVDENTGEKYLIWAMWGCVGDAVKVDRELESGLKEFMGVNEISASSLNTGYEIKVDEYSGIQTLMPKGNVLQGVLLIENEEQQKKINLLAEKYLKEYSGIVSDEDWAESYARKEIKGQCWRTSNGILELGGNALIYQDAKNPQRNWSIRVPEGFQEGNLELLKLITEAIENRVIEGGLESLEGWLELFEGQKEGIIK